MFLLWQDFTIRDKAQIYTLVCWVVFFCCHISVSKKYVELNGTSAIFVISRNLYSYCGVIDLCVSGTNVKTVEYVFMVLETLSNDMHNKALQPTFDCVTFLLPQKRAAVKCG